jgi:hypothetical protein
VFESVQKEVTNMAQLRTCSSLLSSLVPISRPLPKKVNKKPNGIFFERAAIPPEFMCPITMDIMTDPVVAADGFTYERLAIETWLCNHTTSPKANTQMTDNNLTANTTLKVMIQDRLQAEM